MSNIILFALLLALTFTSLALFSISESNSLDISDSNYLEGSIKRCGMTGPNNNFFNFPDGDPLLEIIQKATSCTSLNKLNRPSGY